MRGAVPSIPGQGEILFVQLLLFQLLYLDSCLRNRSCVELFVSVQAGYNHRGCSGRRGALLHPAGSAGLLPEETEEAEEEGDNEEDPARTRGEHKY